MDTIANYLIPQIDTTEGDEKGRKLLKAVDYIIRDVDKKYDECLVDHFVDFIQSNYNYDSTKDKQITILLLDRIKTYFAHRAFVMMNQARAYKVFHAILRDQNEITETNFEELSPYFESLWSTLDIVILNDNLSAVTIMFQILNQISCSDIGLNWMTTCSIGPPIIMRKGLQDYKIKDVIEFIVYYLKTCNNYHSRHKAEILLKNLIEKAIEKDFEKIKWMKNSLKTLVNDDLTLILPIISELIEDRESDKEFLQIMSDLFDLSRILFKNLVRQIKTTGNMTELCKCLALTDSLLGERDYEKVVEILDSENKHEAKIAYLVNYRCKNDSNSLKSLLLGTLLYPLVLKCPADIVTERLMDDLRVFHPQLDNVVMKPDQISDKFITSNLVSINKSIKYYRNKEIHLAQIETVVIHYIMSRKDLKRSYKHVMECCEILNKIFKVDNIWTGWNLDSFYRLLLDLNYDTKEAESILMSLLKSLQFPHTPDPFTIEAVIELAFKFTDDYVLNEFLAYFYISNNINQLHDRKIASNRFIELVWKHVYKIANMTQNRELFGNVYKALICIDFNYGKEFLANHMIVKNDTIPYMIGKALIEDYACIKTVEHIIEALYDTEYLVKIGHEPKVESGEGSYKCLSKSILEILLNGLMVTVRGESDEATRKNALQFIGQLKKMLIDNYGSDHQVIDAINGLDCTTIQIESDPIATCNKVNNFTLIDDIINYELISDGITDCY